MAKSSKPQVLSENLLRQIFKQSGDTFPKLADGRKYFKYNGFSYVETAEGSGRMVPSGRNLGKYNMTLRQLYSGKVNPGVRARTEADSARFAAEREAKAGTAPKKPVGRPRKDGTPAQSRKVKTEVPAKSDIAARDAANTNKTLAELGPDKPKAPRKPLGPTTKPKTAPIGGPKAPPRKPRAPKAKPDSAPKTKSGAPKAPAKGKTPATGSKPSTTPSRPRNRAPKVEKPVSPRLEMKSEFSKIKRNIETSIRQGERKAASKASKAADASTKPTAPAAKKTTAPKPKVEKPKAPAAKKTTAPKAAAKKSAPSGRKTSPKLPPRKAAIPPKPQLTPAQKAAATRKANKAKAQTRRLPGDTFEQKLKNFKGAEPSKVAGKLSRAAKAARPVARVLGRFAGPAGLALTAAEAARLGTTGQGQREYADMRRAIDMGMRGKDVKGRDLVRKGTMYTATADAKKEADTAKRKKLKQASAKAGDARAQAMNRAAYRYTVKKGPRPSGESYTPSKKQDSSGKGANRPSAPMTGRAVRVQRGGTMWDIAQKNNTTVSALYKANPELARRKAAGKTVIYRNTLVKIPGKK